MKIVKSKYRIAFLINDLLIGGAERAFINQANEFASRGYDVFFIVLNDKKIDFDFKKELNSYIFFSSLHFTSLFSFLEFFKLIKFLNKKNVTSLYATLDQANFIARLCKIFLPKLKVVIRESGMADRKSLNIKICDKIFNILPDYILAVSPAVADSLISYQPHYKNKIIVIRNGVFVSEKNIKRKKTSDIKLLNVGSMNNDNKNQLFLIKALSKLKNKNLDFQFKLVLVGEGKMRSLLEKYVTENGLNDQVIFKGKCLPSELDVLYENSDIFVFASKSEGSPNVVLEAMAHSLPVISLEIPSLRGIVLDDKNGYLIKFNNTDKFIDKIESLANDYNLRESLGNGARQFVVDNFSIKAVVNEVENMLCK